MKLIKLTFTLSVAFFLGSTGAKAQLFIDAGTDFLIQGGSFVSVQGDVESLVDIQTDGNNTGALILNGANLQNVNMHGFSIPNLELDNNSGAELGGDAKIAFSLLFTLGKATLHNFNLQLSDIATIAGNGTNKYAETNGIGELQKRVPLVGLNAYEMPVGNGGNYNPLLLTTSGAIAPDALVGVRDTSDVHPKKFAQSTDFLENFWPITQNGVTKLDARGNYIDPLQVTGSDLFFGGFFWKDAQQQWSNTGANVDQGANLAGVTIEGNGDLYAMNNYGLVNAKVLLQGAYDAGVGLMRDDLRKNPDNILSPNLIPVSDPYRTAPYNIMFNHVNNPITEVVNANLFADQASIENDVVDWVFLELRNTPLGNNIIGTRSALVQRDGDVVDLDGVSPIYFKDVAPANNYTLVVKHRNHLGISTMTETVTASLTAPPLVDFTTMTDAEIFGPANAFEVALDGKNMSVAGDDDSVLPDVLWGTAKYSGASNDRVPILSKLNNNPNGNLEGYFREDLTMNRFVKYSGAGNDRVFLLSEVLKNLANSQRKQSIP